jgi:hypothetical protein
MSLKLLTFKCLDFTKTIPFAEFGVIPRKDDVITFNGVKYLVTQCILPFPQNGNADVLLTKIT